MFALGMRYLNGWAMAAADGAKKEKAEWPPHPDRVFMALAAAYFAGDRDADTRTALEWLERLPPPALAASDAAYRDIVTHYVPVNDAAMPAIDSARIDRVSAAQAEDGMAVLPDRRPRQARQFPVAIPHDDSVYLIWHDAAPGATQRAALAQLCTQVTCVGHSASLVQMWVADAPAVATWTPINTLVGAPIALRVPTVGRLQALEADYNESARLSWQQLEHAIAQAAGKAQKALKAERKAHFGDAAPAFNRPRDGLWIGYERISETRDDAPPRASSEFSTRLLILRQTGGRRLGLESTLLLTETLHKYLLKTCPQQPAPEWVSGHATDGGHSRNPHLAAFPLAHVGHPRADGHLLGMAIAVPAAVTAEEIGYGLAPLLSLDDDGNPEPITLYAGERLQAQFRFDVGDSQAQTLMADTWTGPADGAATWASVTPVVLDRHVRRSSSPWEVAEAAVRQACAWAGLPDPVTVVLGPISHFIGSLPAGGKRGSFPSLLRKDGSRRQQVHAVLVFPQPVRGPLLLGAGRYRGYGLFRPWPPRRSHTR